MNEKARTLALLDGIFRQWEELLVGLDQEQIAVPLSPSYLSIKDVIAHLKAWQQVSIERLEAARVGRLPVYPDWTMGDPDQEQKTEAHNAAIYQSYRDITWQQVYLDWRDGFWHFIELGRAASEEELYDLERCPWLHGYPLMAVLEGSYEHHREHYDDVQAWLRKAGAA
jgi:hypothetical protein